MPDPARDGAFRVYYFMVREFSGRPENRAFEQIRWVPLPGLPELDFLEGNREAVRRLAGSQS